MNHLRQLLNREHGAVQIVEAALVYPIVIFVVTIFFFLGNIFYQQSKVDALAVRAAEKLAAYYANPMLYSGIPTSAQDAHLDPYRYIMGNSGAEEAVREYINKELNKTGAGAFAGMEINGHIDTCNVKSYVVYHIATVKITYTIEFKLLELIGISPTLHYSTGTATSAGDPAEFIRNIDMIIDYADATGLSQKIRDTVNQFK